MWSNTDHLPRVLQIFTVIDAKYLCAEPRRIFSAFKSPMLMNGSQFPGSFKGIQISKLGQCKTCLFKIINFGISDYEPIFFLWPNCTSKEKSMLSLERNKFILSTQQDDLASWKTSFFFNTVDTFNQGKKSAFEISFWKNCFNI